MITRGTSDNKSRKGQKRTGRATARAGTARHLARAAGAAARTVLESLEERRLLTTFTPGVIISGGGEIELASSFNLTEITITDAKVTVNGGGTNFQYTQSLTINGTGKLVLNDNDLVVFYPGPTSPVDQIRQYVLNGKSKTSGIINNEVSSYPTAYAVVDNNLTQNAFWGTEVLNDGTGNFNQVIVKYTYAGDVNMDGVVSSADLATLNANIDRTGASWIHGDLDLDGTVTAADRAIVNSTMGAGLIAQTPYGGTPASVPGIVQAENFDNGNDGLAYHDLGELNVGGAYRNTSMDLAATSDSGGGYHLGWVKAAEWAKYAVNVTAAGTYGLNLRVSNAVAGGVMHVEVNGVDVSGPVSIPNTGSFTTWQTLRLPGVALPAGRHEVRLAFDAEGSNGYVANVNWFEFASPEAAAERTPFGGTAPVAPVTVQAENFDTGGRGVGYDDVDDTNRGGKGGRPGGVDIETTSDAGGGFNVGYTAAGEWLEYTVDVAAGGQYAVDYRVANPAAGGKIRLSVDGANLGTVNVPNTGSYTTYQTVTQTGLTLTAGPHVFRVTFDAAASGGWAGNLNWFQVKPPPPAAVTVAATDASASEAGPDNGTFTFTRAYATDEPLAVNYTLGGTATNGSDYSTLGGTVVFAAGQTTATVTLAPIDDTVVEKLGETVVLTVQAGAGYSLGATTSATVTIADNELAPFGAAPAALPAVIQAEDFDHGGAGVAFNDTTAANEGPSTYRTGTGVDIESATDTGGGRNVGWVRAGEWLKYSVSVAQAGFYDLGMRMANAAAGGVLHVEVDGVNVTGAMAVPATGGFQAYQTITKAGINLTAGQHVVRVAFDAAASNGYVGNFNWMEFKKQVAVVTVSATDAAAEESAGDTGTFTFTRTGDTSAAMTVNYTVSGTATNGTDYAYVTGSVTIAAGQASATVTIAPVDDAAFEGLETAIVTLSASANYTLGAATTATVTIADNDQGAFPGPNVPVLPVTIEVENFDNGGEGVAYHDLTPANDGGAYRPSDGVDIATTTDTGGGHAVTAQANEWLTYTVNVPAAGTYAAEFRVAAAGAGGVFHLETLGGTNLTGAMAVPDTGSDQTWVTVAKAVTLPAGTQTVRLVFDANGASGTAGNFNVIRFVARPAAPTGLAAAVDAAAKRIDLAWALGTGAAATEVRVERSAAGGPFGPLATLPAGSAAYADAAVTAGVAYQYRVIASNLAGSSVASNVASGTVPIPVSTPFNGTPAPVPGTIEAEEIDLGGEGVAFHSASAYDDAAGDGAGSRMIQGLLAGDWLNYTVNVAAAGTYQLDVRIAPTGAGTFHLEVGGVDRTGPITLSDPGHQYTWGTLSRSVTLPAGKQVVRLVVDQADAQTYLGWINWFRFSGVPAAPTGVTATVTGTTQVQVAWPALTGTTQSSLRLERKETGGSYATVATLAADATSYTDSGVEPGKSYQYRLIGVNLAGDSAPSNAPTVATPGPLPTPYGGTPAALPGRIEIEGFDNGGLGNAYHDTTAGNSGGANLRPGESVDVETTADAGGGYDVTGQAGDWLQYTVNVGATGKYVLDVRVASLVAGGVFHVEAGGVNVTGPITVTATGGSQAWQTISRAVNLTGGQQTLRVVFDSNSTAGTVGNFNWLRVSTRPAAPSDVTATPANSGPVVNVTWALGTGAGAETAIRVERKIGAGAYETMVTLAPGTVAWTDALAPSSGTFSYRVIALNLAGESAASNEATVTRVATPAGPWGGTPVTISGAAATTLQVELFDVGGQGVSSYDLELANQGGQLRSEGPDIEATQDSGSGYQVSWTKATEWLAYTVNIGASGTYTLDTRVAALGAGGNFHLEVDGANVTGAIAVPNTGGWNTFQTVSRRVTLPAGSHKLRLVFDSVGAAGNTGNFNWLRFTPVTQNPTPVPTQSPFKGTAPNLPGRIQFEDFDNGGEGVAYHDVDTANSGDGASYRTGGVDVQKTTDGGAGYNVGYAKAGEWLEYTVNVPTAGTFNFDFRAANPAAGGKLSILVDDKSVASGIVVPKTASYTAFATFSKTGIAMTAGKHVIRIAFDAVATNGFAGNFNWFEVKAVSPTPTPTPVQRTPYTGSPIAAPGIIELENYDKGGEGLTYRDLESANIGGSYRTGEGVDLQISTDAASGGGYQLSHTKAGEWIEYTVNVAAAGTYKLELRLASATAGGKFHVDFGGVNKTGTITVGNTGGWTSWQTLSVNVTLAAGEQVMRLAFDAVSSSGYVGNFNWARLTPA